MIQLMYRPEIANAFTWAVNADISELTLHECKSGAALAPNVGALAEIFMLRSQDSLLENIFDMADGN